MTKNIKNFLNLNMAVNFIALCVSMYLIHHHFALESMESGFKSFCSVSSTVDCDVVNGSDYSTFLGIPIATFSFGYHLLCLILAFMAGRNVIGRRETMGLSVVLSGFSCLVSVALLFISLTILKTTCLMCMTLYALNTLAFVSILLAWKAAAFEKSFLNEIKALNRSVVVRYLGMTAALILATHFFTYTALSEKIPFDEETFIIRYKAEPKVELPIAHSPVMGTKNEKPKFQVVEFADFQCPHCMLAAKQMHRLLRLHSNDIQLVFKNYPLDMACNPNIKTPMHELGCFSAKATLCANKQGKFESYYEKVFENQTALSEAKFKQWAVELGMDLAQFETCIASKEVSAMVLADIDLADRVHIQGTPTLFVNGKKIEGLLTEDSLKALIKAGADQ